MTISDLGDTKEQQAAYFLLEDQNSTAVVSVPSLSKYHDRVFLTTLA
jgi:hypothetical protein